MVKMKGSDNIFKDLGLSNPKERLAKAKVASMICDIIENRRLTMREAGNILGITRTEMSDITDGRLGDFSMERMFSFLHALDQDIDITVHPKKQNEARLSLSYAGPRPCAEVSGSLLAVINIKKQGGQNAVSCN